MRVLIVGAGIAGPTLAYWLLRAGHEPTLVERAHELRRGGYLIDFWGAGFDVAERMGIVPELVRRGYRAREVRQIKTDGTRMTSFSPEVFVGSTARYVSLARSDLAAVIYSALAGEVETIFGDTVRTIDDDGARVRVTFENGGTGRDFDLVVGTDGLHSKVRQLAFGPDGQFEKYLGFKIAAFGIKGYHPREELVAQLYTGVGFQVTSFPMRDDVTMFALTFVDDGREVPPSRQEQEALLRARFASAGWQTPVIIEQLSTAETLYMDRVSQIRMPSWTRGRVALLGDAAACPSLLAGQGSALAMVEAYVLATELARAGSHAEAFAAYEQRLARFLRSKQKAAERLALAFAPRNGFQLFVRNSVLKLMALPFVADLAAGKSFRDAIELPPAVGA
jgi:2-polyprenyl-6-methoxyphenol hydroxylase-like FAD-dependent oxidoreductase